MIRTLKRAVYHASRTPLFGAAVEALEATTPGQRDSLRVVTYHRVDSIQNRPDLDPAIISAEPSEFARQMQALVTRYTPISAQTLLDAVRTRLPLPERAVMVTFDDAYTDFAKHAWPLLKKLDIPTTLFVPTSYPDASSRRFWWDRLHAALTSVTKPVRVEQSPYRFDVLPGQSQSSRLRWLKTLVKSLPHEEGMQLVEQICEQLDEPQTHDNGVLRWDQLRALAEEGVTLAPHTQSHPLLNRITTDKAVDEVNGSIDDLTREIGTPPVPLLAYPAGGHDTSTVAAVRQSTPIEIALTTENGSNSLSVADAHCLRRINVSQKTSSNLLRLKLLRRPARTPARHPESQRAVAINRALT